MARFYLAALLCAHATLGFGLPKPRSSGLDFFDPRQGGGSWLDNAGDGLGEPLNVKLSFSAAT